MDRRYFLHSSSALSLLTLVAPGVALSTPQTGGERASAGERLFLYDSRFRAARICATECRSSHTIIALQGDITRLWQSMLKPVVQHQPLSIVGVTTMSCHFCLAHLIRGQVQVEEESYRLDHDLLTWSITSRPATDRGRS